MSPELIPEMYAAGFIDGEGSIQINPSKSGGGKRHYWGVTVQISSNCREVLDFLNLIYGGHITSWVSKKSTQKKTSYNLRFYGGDASNILEKVIPYLIIKKEHATMALKFIEFKKRLTERKGLTLDEIQIRNNFAFIMRILNRKYGKSAGGDFPRGVL